MASETLHERFDDLTPETRDMHRAISSLMEELEAVDWYQQRVDATGDEALKAILAHNRDEELEHAMMVLEWMRRKNPTLEAHMKTYLFTRSDVTKIEEAVDEGGDGPSTDVKDAKETKSAAPADGSLGIGSLKI